MPFEPKFSITPKAAAALMRIEAAKQAVYHAAHHPRRPGDLAGDSPALFDALFHHDRGQSSEPGTGVDGDRKPGTTFPAGSATSGKSSGITPPWRKSSSLPRPESHHRAANPGFARAGNGRRRRQGESVSVSRWTECYPGQPYPGHCRYAAGGQGCAGPDERLGRLDRILWGGWACPAPSGPASPITNMRQSIPITTAMAGPERCLPRSFFGTGSDDSWKL